MGPQLGVEIEIVNIFTVNGRNYIYQKVSKLGHKEIFLN